jgi:hypothetical protein
MGNPKGHRHHAAGGCDLMLFEHRDAGDAFCPDDPQHTEALRRRRAGAAEWCAIERGRDAGGSRDFLDGQPIHCGATLELQAIEHHDDDYGSFTLKLPTGVLVRYELAWGKGEERAIELHAAIGGHSIEFRHEQWMRFRWPQRGGR